MPHLNVTKVKLKADSIQQKEEKMLEEINRLIELRPQIEELIEQSKGDKK